MNAILRAALKSSAGTFITLLSSAIAMKVIALVAGPAGVGLFSILRQTQQTASVVGTLGGQAAIVQGLASKEGPERDAYAAAMLRTALAATSLVSVLLVVAAPWLAPMVLGEVANAANVMRLVVVPTILGGAVLFLSGVINSYRAVGTLAVVQVTAGLGLAGFAYPASMRPSGEAFVLLLSASASAAMIVALLCCRRNQWLGFVSRVRAKVGRVSTNEFLRVGGATLATGLMSTGTVLIVRAMVNRHLGLAQAGLFDAAWTISMTYVMLILTSLSAYYLPTLTTLREQGEARNHLIHQYFRFACLASLPLIGSVIVLKPWVIQLLYSKEFLPATQVMKWMLLGDFFKICSWVMAMPMLAYAHTRPFVLSELVWSVAFVGIVAWLLSAGLDFAYIGMAFLACYVGYAAYTYWYCRASFSFRIGTRMTVAWLGVFACLVTLALIA
ncbi:MULTISPECIES: oligosaccharide flippase family protein [unclassified Cupriavidus]|uniref:oligosaccharide flippase family protein n=1 Tax=unclassified Cupriavidus TaxID=2640874 RepID=UPI001C006361|nr:MULTISPECIES: oligosaccharide flippase family protein [unclassified Cupriavidus]MCA3192847.1 oligosaccharide flippase family protein [Cupriavidus sp.]MCA3195048.1 oligosaccharide flippase family protein [Cupriavidus sp.]MCA3204018.1 oligosaccharide flippase family protein [Cupriavidus sp.]QWE93860.1 oligosaccharide flippase family protein [Cupriavidus sp. EM10]